MAVYGEDPGKPSVKGILGLKTTTKQNAILAWLFLDSDGLGVYPNAFAFLLNEKSRRGRV